MMFITPMPPTRSEIAATAVISRVRVARVVSMVLRTLSLLCRKKSFRPWRTCMKWSIAACAASEVVPSGTRMVMLRR